MLLLPGVAAAAAAAAAAAEEKEEEITMPLPEKRLLTAWEENNRKLLS